MSWVGDLERNDPAYPGRPGDMTTTSWSQLDAEVLREVLRDEQAAEDAAYVGRHRRRSPTEPSWWPAIS